MRRADDDQRSPLHVTHISPTAGEAEAKYCQPSRLAASLSLSLSLSLSPSLSLSMCRSLSLSLSVSPPPPTLS